jgi:epoxyqueuosine reductase QueG
MARALGTLGLNILLPLTADGAAASSFPLEQLLPGAVSALIVGSGGPAFFDRFARAAEASDGAANPLDRYTRRVVEDALDEALDPLGPRRAVHFPFGTRPLIPFQRLGWAAGLGGPGPLGLQIHPTYGAWWAYRALAVVDCALPASRPPGDGCAGCDAPCVAACPAAAVARTGFVVSACQARRLVAEPCRLSCVARIACVRGPEHRYSEAELAFHMAASMPDAGLTARRSVP